MTFVVNQLHTPHFRIEWGCTVVPSSAKQISFDFIQVCHEDCSYGIRSGSNHPVTFGDIIFDQLPYDADLLNQRLSELSSQHPLLHDSIEGIRNKLLTE